MSEAEEQLRRVLREHAADSEHLLDEWKEEMLAEMRKERGLANARDTRLTHAEEKALRDSLSALREVLADAHRSREHTKQWYAERLERLKQMAKERGFWPEMAAILANGTATMHEPPSYAQLLNRAKHRAELAEEALSALREAVGTVLESVRKVVVMAKDWGPAFKSIRIEMDLDSARAFIAAYDAAPAAPTHATNEHGDCAPWCRACRSNLALGLHPDGSARAGAPTLTLEEVDEETCDQCGMQPSKGHSYMPVYGDELPQMCPLAQKGAGRG